MDGAHLYLDKCCHGCHEGLNLNQRALKLVPPLALNYGPSMVNPMAHVNNSMLNGVWTEEL